MFLYTYFLLKLILLFEGLTDALLIMLPLRVLRTSLSICFLSFFPNFSISLQLIEEHGDLIPLLREASGWTEEMINPINLMWILADNTVCQKAHNISVPGIIQDNFPLLQEWMKKTEWLEFGLPGGKDDPRGSSGGELLRLIGKNLNDRVNGLFLLLLA